MCSTEQKLRQYIYVSTISVTLKQKLLISKGNHLNISQLKNFILVKGLYMNFENFKKGIKLQGSTIHLCKNSKLFGLEPDLHIILSREICIGSMIKKLNTAK